MHVDDFLLYRSDLRAGTIYQYRNQLRKFFKWFSDCGGEPYIGEITTSNIAAYLTDLRDKNFSWSSRHAAYVAISAFFDWAVLAGRLDKSPFDKRLIKRPRQPKQVTKPVSLSTATKIIQYAEQQNTPIGRRDTAIFRLLLNTGVRRGECAGIQLGRINWDIPRILIDGKAGDQRFIYPSANTMAAIRAWVENRPLTADQSLFVSMAEPHHRLKATGFGDIIKKYAEGAGVPEYESISPHAWRHTFATTFIENGGDQFALKELMGHNYLSSTDRYVSPSKEHLQRSVSSAAPDV